MKNPNPSLTTGVIIAGVLFLAGCSAPAPVAEQPQPAADPLPSWNDSAARTSIVDFVERITEPDSPDFVPEPERIAVFDNDGTLWSEQPIVLPALFRH